MKLCSRNKHRRTRLTSWEWKDLLQPNTAVSVTNHFERWESSRKTKYFSYGYSWSWSRGCFEDIDPISLHSGIREKMCNKLTLLLVIIFIRTSSSNLKPIGSLLLVYVVLVTPGQLQADAVVVQLTSFGLRVKSKDWNCFWQNFHGFDWLGSWFDFQLLLMMIKKAVRSSVEK